MAQIARTGAEKAPATAKDTTDNAAELGKRTAGQTAEIARAATDKTEDVARRGLQVVQRTAEMEREVAHQTAEGSARFGRAFLDLANEQSRHNLETLEALSGAVDWNRFAKAVNWDQVFQIQRAYLRASLERTARLTQSYLKISQAVMTSAAAAAAQRQAKKAA
jgi:hypothetical protein